MEDSKINQLTMDHSKGRMDGKVGTKTNIGQNSGGSYHPAGQALSKIVAAFPVNWYGDPEDIAKTCLFLCSDDARHINGAVIAVDGGMACC